jgi:HlyD family secretion protein
MHNSDIDNLDPIGHARKVEAPPILKATTDAPHPKRKGHGKLIIFIICVVLLLAAAVFYAFGHKAPPISVQTEKVVRRTITETVVANGKIYPVLQVPLSAEVSGEIIELPVKEGQFVHKGDLLVKINPKTPLAELNQAKASYESSLASVTTAKANLEKAQTDFDRNQQLLDQKLLSQSDYIGFKVALDVARAQLDAAGHSVEVAQAAVDSAQDSFDKTTISAPCDGTITVLNSQLGERVLGTVQNTGTEIMTISDLSQMEARVNIGEMDIISLKPGEKATLEVDSLKDQKFAGVVTDVANSSLDLDSGSSSSSSSSSGSSSSGQAATQFQVRIRLLEGKDFRPGMSVSATIETQTRTNVIAAPIASVTTRVVKAQPKPAAGSSKTNSIATNSVASSNLLATAVDPPATNSVKKPEDHNKPVDVVFVVEGDHVKTVPVKIGISDDNYWEVTDGLKEGDEIVTGGFKAIGRDLDDGKKITKGHGNLASSQ